MAAHAGAQHNRGRSRGAGPASGFRRPLTFGFCLLLPTFARAASRRRWSGGSASGNSILGNAPGREIFAAEVVGTQARTTRLILSSVKVWPPIDSTGGLLVTSTESTTPCTSLEIATDWPLASLAVTDSV